MALTNTIAFLLCLVGTAGGTLPALCIPPPKSTASTPRSAASLVIAPTPRGRGVIIVDWRANGAVTPVMYLGEIGSCWAISAVGAIEGLHKICTRRLVSLSSQEIYDCSNKSIDDSHLKALNWVAHNGGVASEQTYPYTGKVQDCQREKLRMISVSIRNFKWDIFNEHDLLIQVGHQPVAVRMLLDPTSFYNYTGVVFTGPCGDQGHSMLAVGFGATEDGTRYWILKNSYGVHWGDHGYFHVQRGPNHGQGLCGLAILAAYPI